MINNLTLKKEKEQKKNKIVSFKHIDNTLFKKIFLTSSSIISKDVIIDCLYIRTSSKTCRKIDNFHITSLCWNFIFTTDTQEGQKSSWNLQVLNLTIFMDSELTNDPLTSHECCFSFLNLIPLLRFSLPKKKHQGGHEQLATRSNTC